MLSRMERGRYGERMAEEYLVGRGWVVLARNVRPCAWDRRCEIDLIMRSRRGDAVLFVEVKAHERETAFSHRLQGIDERKKKALVRGCTVWLKRMRWHGNFRFDVVEVWGGDTSGEVPRIDHIENVPLFHPNWRFW